MKQPLKIYYETDAIGKHKVLDYGNGKKIRVLKEPSEAYAEKQKKRAEAEKEKRAEREAGQEKEKLIRDKMRELAIAELTKEGKL